MAWVKIDDKFTDHPKLVSVGPLGVALQIAALCYSNAHLTDGFIQYNVVPKLLCWEFSPPGSKVVMTISITSGMSGDDVTWKMVADWLVDAGVWTEVEGGYQIHDYQDYQPLKKDVLEERSKALSRMNALRGKTVRPNNGRTKGEHSPKFNDPVPVPVPVPVPLKAEEEESAAAAPNSLTYTDAGSQVLPILARATGLIALPPSENARIDQITSLIQCYGTEAVETQLRAVYQRWTHTSRKNNGGTYSPTNLGWVDWAQAELMKSIGDVIDYDTVDPQTLHGKELDKWAQKRLEKSQKTSD